MAYIQRSDYSRVISNQDLRDILEEANEYFQGKDESTVLSEAGAMAQAKIEMIISGAYDTATEFAKDGTLSLDIREQNVLRCYLHIAVYNLHFVVNPRDIPELRQMAYDNCITELEKARDSELILGLDPIEGNSRLGQFTGHTKFISKPYTDPSLIDDSV